MAGKLTVPLRFLGVSYNGHNCPGASYPEDLSTGANCQAFAYAILGHFGFPFPPLRSRELWADLDHSAHVSELEPLDLLLFAATEEPYGAHVALYLGEGQAIHLSRAVGLPAVWPVEQFALHENYRVFIGAKRPRRM